MFEPESHVPRWPCQERNIRNCSKPARMLASTSERQDKQSPCPPGPGSLAASASSTRPRLRARPGPSVAWRHVGAHFAFSVRSLRWPAHTLTFVESPLLALAILYPAPQSELGLFSCHGIQLTNPGNSCPLGQTQLSHLPVSESPVQWVLASQQASYATAAITRLPGAGSRGRDLASH